MSNPLIRKLQQQAGMLSAQFLLGMGENLIGLPKETTGAGHAASIIILALHVLLALGLLINSLAIVRTAATAGNRQRKLALMGAGGIVLAMLGGVLTLSAPWSNLWSFVMAVGFLGTFGAYGRMMLPAAEKAS